MGTRIAGVGSCLPSHVVTNHDIEARTTYDPAEHRGLSLDDWARAHHGGQLRHVAAPGQATSDLATGAARAALDDAGLTAADVDLIVLATFTGDHRLPQAAGQVQRNLGSRAKFLQVDSACTGFIDGLLVAHSLLETGAYRRALVLAADVTSMLNDPDDWLQQTVFGDGAGGVVLERDGRGCRTLFISTGSDGDLGEYVFVPGGGSRRPVSAEVLRAGLHHWRFRFAEITAWACDRMVLATREVVARAGIKLDEVALIVPHQASKRIIDDYAAAIDYPRERILTTYPELGNVSGASIPVSLDMALRRGCIHPGDWLVMPAVGAGMAWGAAAYRWAGGTGPTGTA
jgi:3-oxoacyl-[acyl-carrier-protein] synthase-3